MKMCALVVGHKKTSPGAENKKSRLTEFDYNDELAREIEKAVKGVKVQRVYRRTYNTLPGDIDDLNPDFIVSLHCNAYNGKATGTEVLYYHRSKKGEKIAKLLNSELVGALGLKDRGIKPKTSEDRGGYLLRNTNAPCVIAEPFFIDNDDDLRAAKKNRKALVSAYAFAIKAIAKNT
jgi:N-acetylmuramoyl-L-alanine amidase